MQSFIYSPFGSAQDRDFELAIYCTILIVLGTTRDYKNRNSSGLNQKRYSKKGKEALFLRLQKSTVKTLPRNPVFINTPIITLICITLKISGKLTLLQSISLIVPMRQIMRAMMGVITMQTVLQSCPL